MRFRPLFAASIAASISTAIAVPARAQQPPLTAPAAPRDTVTLKSGAIYRGVITELVPNVSVEIMLVNGSTKKFTWGEVDYAGASDQMPGAPPPLPAPPPGPPPSPPPAPVSELSFRADGDGGEMITLHEVTGSAYGVITGYRISAYAEAHSFKTLCSSPCKPNLAPGTYELALSQGDGRPMMRQRVIVPAGPATIHGTYTSRSGLRTAGWIVLAAGIGAGAALMLHPFMAPTKTCESDSFCSNSYNLTEFLIGTGVMCASAIVGVILATRGDLVGIEVIPGVQQARAPRTPWASAMKAPHAAGREPAGLTLRARF